MQEYLKVPDTNYGHLGDSALVPDTVTLVTPVDSTPIEMPDKGIERALYGKWTLALRNLCGVFTVITVCVVAGFNAWTTNKSVSLGYGWPSDWVIITVNVGPIICAWAFLSASKVLTAILKTGDDGESISTRLRRRIAKVVDPGDPPGPPGMQ
jgi:hypothetical protein